LSLLNCTPQYSVASTKRALHQSLSFSPSVITACIWGALPPAIALFPPKYGISPRDLEPEFHSRTEELLYFNKGI
jgi:hypothetical protein